VLEVRCRRVGSGRDLGFRNCDKPQRPYVLVHANPPRFKLVGWILGRDGWAIGQPNEKTGLHFVTEQQLRPVVELLTVLPPRRPG
jgi:hypothetical protein